METTNISREIARLSKMSPKQLRVKYLEVFGEDLCFRRENSDFTNDSGGITYETERWHLTGVQFSTVAVLDGAAEMIERVTYDPYGVARHHRAADIDGAGMSIPMNTTTTSSRTGTTRARTRRT